MFQEQKKCKIKGLMSEKVITDKWQRGGGTKRYRIKVTTLQVESEEAHNLLDSQEGILLEREKR